MTKHEICKDCKMLDKEYGKAHGLIDDEAFTGAEEYCAAPISECKHHKDTQKLVLDWEERNVVLGHEVYFGKFYLYTHVFRDRWFFVVMDIKYNNAFASAQEAMLAAEAELGRIISKAFIGALKAGLIAISKDILNALNNKIFADCALNEQHGVIYIESLDGYNIGENGLVAKERMKQLSKNLTTRESEEAKLNKPDLCSCYLGALEKDSNEVCCRCNKQIDPMRSDLYSVKKGQ